MTRELKEIIGMRQHAASVSRAQKDIERIKLAIADLESSLSDANGSARTADDVQQELDRVSSDLCVFRGIPFFSGAC